jgi:hypothetical protein
MIVQISAEQTDLTVTMRCGGKYNPSVFRELRDHAVATFREVWAGLPEDGEPVVVEETLEQPAQPDE